MKSLLIKNNKALLFILFCFYCLSSISQTNTEKYWYYRDRMFNGFMIMGDGLGYSNVAGIRNLEKGYLGKTESFDLHYGQHCIYMGWYIGVLATEFAILKQQGLSTEKTLTELYYALNAIERLDALSGSAPPVNSQNNFPQHEEYCPQLIQMPITPDGLNGFFIRDDVPYGFIDPNIYNSNYNKINSRVNDFNYNEVNYAYSDYTAGNKHWNLHTLDSVSVSGDDYAKEMSQDELYHLMMGLALVKHFVDDTQLQIKLMDGSIINNNLNYRARAFVIRCVYRISASFWAIFNPNTGWLVHQGPCPGPLVFGLDKACEFITGASFLSNNPTQFGIAFALWQGLINDNIGIHSNPDNAHMVAVLAAIGNSFISINPSLNNSEATANRINDICNNYDWETFYCSLRALLHGGPNPISISKLIDQLNQAPCEGPYNIGSSFSVGWGSSHKFFHDRNKSLYGNVGAFTGYYNGLDYMLLHNITYLLYPSLFNSSVVDRYLTSPNDDLPGVVVLPPGFVPPFIVFGNSSNPANIEAVKNIYASNKLNSNAVATYKAGEEIIFTDGFEVVSGAEFHAYIEPYSCTFSGLAPPNNNEEDKLPNEYIAYSKFERFPSKLSSNEFEYIFPVEVNKTVLNKTNLLVQQDYNFSIHPNPNSGMFTINVQTLNEQEQLQLSVMDVYGKQILNQQITNSVNHPIDLSVYSKGIYYVSVTGNSGFREVKKVVVN